MQACTLIQEALVQLTLNSVAATAYGRAWTAGGELICKVTGMVTRKVWALLAVPRLSDSYG